MVVEDTARNHPKGLAQAYPDIGKILGACGFERLLGSVYVTSNEDMANLFVAGQPWFP